jgi:hypothetical protein
MDELKMPGVKSDATNAPLQGLGWVIFSVANDRVADR